MSMSNSRLFQPIQVGRMTLQHRVVQPALTSNRIDKVSRAVGDDVVEHYALRAAVPGTLIIGEATYITHKDTAIQNWQYTPGVYSAEQIAQWKKVVDAVHARGSYIYLQLWAVGREADPDILAALDPSYPYISASGVFREGYSRPPRALTREEIQEYVRLFVEAARAAVYEAGFDGVEVNAGGVYLLDEFQKESLNTRTDEYGGSPENRSRFTLEVIDAVAAAVGADRVGLKLMPWDVTRALSAEESQVPTLSYLVAEMRRRQPALAFLHATETRFGSFMGRAAAARESNDFLREIWRGKPYISDGGYGRETAIAQADADEHALVAFGRHYTSNPDLPIRLEHSIPLTPYARETFFTPLDPVGYNTFGWAEESKAILAKRAAGQHQLVREPVVEPAHSGAQAIPVVA